AGAIVSAQQPEGGRSKPSGPATTETRPTRAVPANGGNFIVDWTPADGQGVRKQIIVDPTRNSLHLPWMSQKRDDRPNDGAVRVELERGKYYKVTATGEAFMSDQTGANADPYPGVVVIYPTDMEDCYAIRQIVLAPGKSITFRSPWLIAPNNDVFLLAFFLDTYTGSPKRGSYTLTIEETGDQANEETAGRAAQERTIKAPFDDIITEKRQRFFELGAGAFY
ncbi:hypothetical protein ACYOEI_21795, partial [Singulisphaera rosea]